MWKYQLQSMVVESAIRKIRKIEVFKKWKLQSMDCNQDYYHSQYWLQPDYYGNMDTMNYSNNYNWYICSVIEWPLNGRCFSVLLQFSSNSRIENVSGQDNHVTWKIGNDSPEKFMAFIRRAYIALQLRVSHKWRQYLLKFGLFEKGTEF